MRVSIIGAGRVGAPLGAWLMNKRIYVKFIDINKELLEKVVTGTLDWEEPYLNETLQDEAEYIVHSEHQPIKWAFICVGTPVVDGKPILDTISNIIRDIPMHTNIVLRSTVSPGTCDKLSKEFNRTIWHAPERLLLGNGMEELDELPQIVGATGLDYPLRNAEFAKDFSNCFPSFSYGKAVEAECAKVSNNIVRYIEFATGTELSQMFEMVGADNHTVRHLMTNGYKRGRIAFPAFVGSYCLDKDWQMLRHVTGTPQIMAQAAANYNHGLINRLLSNVEINADTTVAILGMTYKPNLDDCRETPSLRIFDEVMLRPVKQINYHDPLVSITDTFKELHPLADMSKIVIYLPAQEAVQNADVVIMATAHDEYLHDSLEFKDGATIIDPTGTISVSNTQFVWEVK